MLAACVRGGTIRPMVPQALSATAAYLNLLIGTIESVVLRGGDNHVPLKLGAVRQFDPVSRKLRNRVMKSVNNFDVAAVKLLIITAIAVRRACVQFGGDQPPSFLLYLLRSRIFFCR